MSRASPGTKLSRDGSPLGPVLMPPEDGRDRAAQLLRRGLTPRPARLDQRRQLSPFCVFQNYSSQSGGAKRPHTEHVQGRTGRRPMPLKIDLKPFERLIINGALIRNGSRRSSLLVETECKFLRETEILHESEADTPAKRLCITLQVIYLSDDPIVATSLFHEQAVELLHAAPSMATFMTAIQQELEAKRHHAAIKRGRELILFERAILESLS